MELFALDPVAGFARTWSRWYVPGRPTTRRTTWRRSRPTGRIRPTPMCWRARSPGRLDAALPERLRARLADGDPVAVVVSVPDLSWVLPVEDALRRLAPAVSVVARDGSSRSQHKPSVCGPEVAYALAGGRPVVGVAASPEAFLPALLVSSADGRVDLAPPSGVALRRLLRQFARGPVPRDLGPAPCASLTFDEILSAFRAGATAREVLANFGRTVVRKSMASPRNDTPTLNALPGFSGEARAWGEARVESFSLYRAGRVPWTARRQSARGHIAAPVFGWEQKHVAGTDGMYGGKKLPRYSPPSVGMRLRISSSNISAASGWLPLHSM